MLSVTTDSEDIISSWFWEAFPIFPISYFPGSALFGYLMYPKLDSL